MQFKTFSIPLVGGERINEDLNVFLRSKKVLSVDKQLVVSSGAAFWSFCVGYLDETVASTKERVDYRKILDPDAFARFSNMREIRKKIADDEGIPAFAIFTDEELSGLAKIENLDLQSMRTVKGVGEKKVEKYGKQFLPK